MELEERHNMSKETLLETLNSEKRGQYEFYADRTLRHLLGGLLYNQMKTEGRIILHSEDLENVWFDLDGVRIDVVKSGLPGGRYLEYEGNILSSLDQFLALLEKDENG